MLKRLLFSLGLIVFVVVVSILWTSGLGTTLFHAVRWILIGTFVVGTAAGIVGAELKNTIRSRAFNKQPERHSIDSVMEHWGTAIGIFILIVSGFRMLTGSGFLVRKMHFLGVFLTLLFGSYFLADFFVSKKYKTLLPNLKDIINGIKNNGRLRLKSKETDKYLSSQKWAFLAFAILGALIFISGVIKLIALYVPISFRILTTATSVHNISALFFVLLLLVHILLVTVRRTNWPRLLSWFTGKPLR